MLVDLRKLALLIRRRPRLLAWHSEEGESCLKILLGRLQLGLGQVGACSLVEEGVHLVLRVLFVELHALRGKMDDMVRQTEVVRRVADADVSLHGQVHHVWILMHVYFCDCCDLAEANFIKLHRMLKLIVRKMIISACLDVLDGLFGQIVDIRRDHVGVLLGGSHALRLLLLSHHLSWHATLLVKPGSDVLSVDCIRMMSIRRVVVRRWLWR